MLAKVHLFGGILVVICFLLTGQYLDQIFAFRHIDGDVVRYMYRANHVYILFSGLLNIAIGAGFALHELDWKRALQYLGSLLLCVAPGVLIYAFLVETNTGESDRFFTGLGVVFLLIGTMLYVPSSSIFTRE